MTKGSYSVDFQEPVTIKEKNDKHQKRQIALFSEDLKSHPFLCNVILPPYIPASIKNSPPLNTFYIKPVKYSKHTTSIFPKSTQKSVYKPTQHYSAIPDVFYHLPNFNIYQLSKAEFRDLPEPAPEVRNIKGESAVIT